MKNAANQKPTPLTRVSLKTNFLSVAPVRHGSRKCLLAVLLFFQSWLCYGDPLDRWSLRNPVTEQPLCSVTYNGSTFVAVGYLGTILTSTNGAFWAAHSVPINDWLYGVGYGNGLFVAVGAAGSIFTSPDGVTWTNRISSVSVDLRGVAFGNGAFVVVGNSGTILVSTNGASWSTRNSGTSEILSQCLYGQSLFVATGNSGTILTSTDAVSWTPRVSGTSDAIYGVAFGNGLFVGAVYCCSGGFVTSGNGLDWSFHAGQPYVYSQGLGFGDGTFVAVGLIDSGPTVDPTIMSSTDGINWTRRFVPIPFGLLDVTYGAGTFVAVGGQGAIMQTDPAAVAPPGLAIQFYAGLSITGIVGRAYTVEYTANLQATNDWHTATNIMLTTSPQVWIDFNSVNSPRRLYRAALIP